MFLRVCYAHLEVPFQINGNYFDLNPKQITFEITSAQLTILRKFSVSNTQHRLNISPSTVIYIIPTHIASSFHSNPSIQLNIHNQ